MSSYFVDVVDEDSFYENLLLGVTRVLESNPCVKKIELERKNACDRSLISAWEQKHCCLLTEDLRNFYTSTDGFVLTWSLEIAGPIIYLNIYRSFNNFFFFYYSINR